MRLRSVPPLLLALLWALASVAAPLRAADDPGARYLGGFESFQAGSRLEADGKLDEAIQKYQACITQLEQIQRTNPDYYPVLIDYRLKKSRESIARVQSARQAPSSPTALDNLPSSPVPVPRTNPSSPLLGGNWLRDRGHTFSTGTPVPRPASPDSTVSETADQVIIDALKGKITSLQEQLTDQNQAIEDLKGQLLESTAQIQMVQKENDLRKVREVEQQSELAQLHQSNEDLQQANGLLSKEKESDQRQIADLQANLEAARADIEVADEYNGELFSKLERAAKYIAQGEKINAQLLIDRKELSARVLDGSPDTKRLEKERDAAVEKRDDLQKQVDDSEKVADQNKLLSKKLADAEAHLVELSKDKDQRQKIEGGLRDEVASVNKTLAAMRDQLKSGQQRITELEKQLSETADASANVTGQMADENALLKSLVSRQLKEQAKRQQARKLVEEEMEKLRIRSATLLDKLNSLAGDEEPLTPREKKLVTQPAAMQGGRSDFTLEVVKKIPESDLPSELMAKASEANDLAQKNQFSEARDIYAEIAKKAPQSYLAAMNLGIAERQLGDYAQAVTAFKRALELKHDDAIALTNLGTVQYRIGDLDEAVKVLQQAVTVDSESYLAHYFLGVALNAQGDRDGARREVQRSLDLKSDYAPAMELNDDLRKSPQKPSESETASKKQE